MPIIKASSKTAFHQELIEQDCMAWPDNMRAKHLHEGIRDFENCVRCHRSGREGEDDD
jgi:hypothetical protein